MHTLRSSALLTRSLLLVLPSPGRPLAASAAWLPHFAPPRRRAFVAAAGPPDGALPLLRLAETLRAVEEEPARLKGVGLMTELLAETMSAAPGELLPCVALATMQLLPSAKPLKLGVGESLVVQALARASGQDAGELKAELVRCGDIGELTSATLAATESAGAAEGAAAEARGPLTMREVHASLLEVHAQSGGGAQERKVALLGAMLGRASPIEGLLIVRAVRGRLRSGLGDKGMRDALAAAAAAGSGDEESGVAAALEASRAAEARLAAAEAAEAGLDASDPKAAKAAAKATRAATREASKASKAAGAARAASRRRAASLVNEAFSVSPCYHALVGRLTGGSVWELDGSYAAVAGVPVQPMVATPAASIEGALERLVGRPLLCEWKYDGERCQAHLLPPPAAAAEAAAAEAAAEAADGRVRLYSRSLDEMTARFPELTAALPAALGSGGRSAVIDAELCAVDDDTGAVLPFQTLASRPRKAPTAEQLEAGPSVCLYAFDLLELDGRSLLGLPLAERRRLLASALNPVRHRVAFAEGVEVHTEEQLRSELDRAIDCQAEGLMLKALRPDDVAHSHTTAAGSAGSGAATSAGYEAGKRSLQWLKLKRDYIDGMGDTFDLVPIGAYRGRGKRSGAFGAYLLASYDAVSRRWQPICKCGTGFSDEELGEFTARLEGTGWEGAVGDGPESAAMIDLEADLPPNLQPHVWLPPSVVWEVSATEVSVSPVYRAAFDDVAEGKGLALRFPRFVRERPDKAPADATSASQLAEIFRTQPVNSAAGE